MRVIIEIPDKYLYMVSGIITESIDDCEDIVDAAIERCKGADVEADLKDLDLSKGELIQLNIAMATIAVTKMLDEKD